MSEQKTTPQIPKLLFQYIYSNGERFFKKEFTIDEILAGDPINILFQSKMLEGFKIISERQFSGKTLINGAKIFDGDILRLICPADNDEVSEYLTAVEFVPEANAFLVSTKEHNDCFLGVISDSPLSAERSHIEIMGNTTENPELLIEYQETQEPDTACESCRKLFVWDDMVHAEQDFCQECYDELKENPDFIGETDAE